MCVRETERRGGMTGECVGGFVWRLFSQPPTEQPAPNQSGAGVVILIWALIFFGAEKNFDLPLDVAHTVGSALKYFICQAEEL